MAAAHNQPREVNELDRQHDRHHGGDADHRNDNPIGGQLGRGIGRLLFHAADGDADA